MRTLTLFLLLSFASALQGQSTFDKYFTGKVLRFDFMLAGNSQKTLVYLAGMKEEPFYAGSKVNLTDSFNYGNFKYELFDASDNSLIYSRGFSTLFQEWQTTAEARSVDRSFYEVATMPFPKNKVKFVLSMREKSGSFSKLFGQTRSAKDYLFLSIL